MKIVEVMQSLKLFSKFSHEELQMLSVVFRLQQYEEGKSIFREGYAGAGFFVVASGAVDLYQEPIPGKKTHVGSQGPGTILGQISIIDGGRRIASAEASTAVTMLAMDRADWQRLCDANSSFAYKLMDLILKDLSLRLRSANEQLERIDGNKVQSVEAMLRAIEKAHKLVNTTSEMRALR